MIDIIFFNTKPFSEPSLPVDGGGVVLEETTAIRIEKKMIVFVLFPLICHPSESVAGRKAGGTLSTVKLKQH